MRWTQAKLEGMGPAAAGGARLRRARGILGDFRWAFVGMDLHWRLVLYLCPLSNSGNR